VPKINRGGDTLAQRGRKPKPTALKKLEGNPGKRQLNINEPIPERTAPECPDWLSDEAQTEWHRLADKMERMGILTDIDMAAFAGYCQSYARWKEAEEFITKHGSIVKTPSGYWQQVPQVSIAQQYLKDMQKFAEQFGLTPASRSRIVADVQKNEYIDEMDRLLGGDM
jgi:P27 family predicted phage terminase small subunit